MYKMLKVTAISVVAALVLAMPVFAQTSPTNTATAGVFTTDVENSMDVHRYSEVEFERWAGFLGHSGESDRPVSLGFATRFGGIHLGTWFTGNFANFDRVEGENVTTTYDLTNMIPIQRVTTTTFSDQVTRTNNQLHALIGVAGMGFRVGLHHDWETWSNPDRIITVTETLSGTTTTYMNQVDEFSRTTGSLIPTLEWGMNLAAGNLVIRPNVFLGFELYRDSEIFNTRPVFTTDNGNLVGNFTVERSGHNEGFMAPSFGVGAEIDLPSGENSTVTIGLSYGLGMRLFDNSFDDSGFSGSVNGTVSWGHG
ncbi:MAG: hypothetical protein FWC97_02890, partial [Treponema sp.]|nr:hypothetical protein [Treponema sp.]